MNNKSTEADVISAIHHMRATHPGLKFSIHLSAETFTNATPFQSLRNEIESKFFQGRGIGAFDKLPPGKRPDTLRFKGPEPFPRYHFHHMHPETLTLALILTPFGAISTMHRLRWPTLTILLKPSPSLPFILDRNSEEMACGCGGGGRFKLISSYPRPQEHPLQIR